MAFSSYEDAASFNNKLQIKDSDGELIGIVVRRCGESQFEDAICEVFISKPLTLKYINVVSKYIVENSDSFFANKYRVIGSLHEYLTNFTDLTWIKRLKICLGIAQELCYLHGLLDDDDTFVIYTDIERSVIILNENWDPIFLGYILRFARDTNQNGELQYMDPAYEIIKTFQNTDKSDVFSFGVVLFEILSGSMVSTQNRDHSYFNRLARLHYEARTLDDIINPGLRQQMDQQSLKLFSETAYCCLKLLQAERPTMDQVVKKLEAALDLQQKHEINENLNHLKIRLSDIESATNNFSKANYIGNGGYGMVYKAELDHFDGNILSEMESKNNSHEFFEFPKRRSTVAIKRLFSRIDGPGESGFFAEIEMLSKCHHPNIVSLLGFCEEGHDQILIYEYVANGSLNDYFGNTKNMTNLSWSRSLQICLDIANGLNYLHTSTKEKEMIIHRDIKSDNILLDHNWVAKIADFGLSKLRPANQNASTINTVHVAGTDVYLDPEYLKTGKLKKESDIYSLGVVLFEIMCGRAAYDEIYYANNNNGLPSVIRRSRFEKISLEEMIDPKLKEANEVIFMLNGGINQESLDTFINIAYKCLEIVQADRPTTKDIIEELQKALNYQKNNKDKLQISLRDIKLWTEDFSDDKLIAEGRNWRKYEGEIPHYNVAIIAKRFDSKSIQAENQNFLQELKAPFEYKHKNIISLVGYCNEMDEKIIVYEHGSNGSLDKHLNNASLTWTKRLHICIDIASGLEFLHNVDLIHRDIKSSSIVIDGDWKAKISNLNLTADFWERNEKVNHDTSLLGYVDKKLGIITQYFDIHSLGEVLVEIFCGRTATDIATDILEKCKYSDVAYHELMFEGLKGHSDSSSLTTFFKIATKCLMLDIYSQPDVNEVVAQLKYALELQEDYEIWKHKLPSDYKQIILNSNSPRKYLLASQKELYDMFTTEGILLREGKSWFVLGSNGERNEMVSATKFAYRNRCPYRWRSLPESRFHKVAEMLDISNLMIKIKTTPQLLTPNSVYGVYLVFKFCNSGNISSKHMYVHLKYRKGNETFHTYFATWRDDKWMMIELYRFLNQKDDVVFKFLLESLSPRYPGDEAIYVEGVQFRAIENVDHEEVEKSKANVVQVQQLPMKSEDIYKRSQNYVDVEKLFISEVNGKKHLMLSAKEALHNFSDLKLFNSKPSAESRFQEVIEVLPQPAFRIDCTIKNQILSEDTEYACYLVFKLSENCQGLHCPVEVRDLLHGENKEVSVIYFKFPSPWDIHDITRVPEQREDGWMEVNVWKFKSQHGTSYNSGVPVKLKLISYQGTMSGLIVCGLEFRPM